MNPKMDNDTRLSALLANDTAENYLETLEEWFLHYVATELANYDQEAHDRHVNHYQHLKQLFIDH